MSIVEKNILIGENNEISSSVVIHDNVIIGNNNFIGDDVVIYPNTIIGNNNIIFKGNVIGEFPVNSSSDFQKYDLYKCKGVFIGDFNFFHVKNLIFSGIDNKTYFGNHNKILAECHIGHDTQIYNYVTIYPRVITGGYSEFLEHSNIGMYAVIHQKRIIGQYSMVGANNMVSKNVFPYYITINNKIHRLNEMKIPDYVKNYDDELINISKQIEMKNYDLSNYNIPENIKNDLLFFLNRVSLF